MRQLVGGLVGGVVGGQGGGLVDPSLSLASLHPLPFSVLLPSLTSHFLLPAGGLVGGLIGVLVRRLVVYLVRRLVY
jgi:hypothetical protein